MGRRTFSLIPSPILKKLKERGKKVDFLNTYRPSFFEAQQQNKLKKISCSTVTALAAEIPLHRQKDLQERKSICHDLTNEVFRAQGFEAPLFTPSEAGKIMAQASSGSNFLMFEHFLTDFAGHAQNMEQSKKIIQHLEDFLESALSSLDLSSTTFLIVSDHGNLEDLSVKTHTQNPALCMSWGKHAQIFIERCKSIQDPYHVILELMK
ncbi:MAG: hypothetical protein HYS08_08835 [Chlamydiae bacterium]|nr:hypothetical protein [Chlamydiota bacterium]MBI3265468.1 hypothetical protein [Chlamydiota bacterium]